MPDRVAAVEFGGRNWGMELFEDVSSRAAEGEVRLYGVQLHDFAVLRPSAFVRHRFRNS